MAKKQGKRYHEIGFGGSIVFLYAPLLRGSAGRHDEPASSEKLRRELTVRLKEEQIEKLAVRITTVLSDTALAKPKVDRARINECIRNVIKADLKAEDDLEKEAEALLEKTLRAMGGGGDIDRHKMLRMIKVKLAQEKKMVI